MEIMKALLAKGADVNKRGGDYGTCLQVCIRRHVIVLLVLTHFRPLHGLVMPIT